MTNFHYTADEAKKVRKEHLNYIGGTIDGELTIDYLIIVPDDNNFDSAIQAQIVHKADADIIADKYGNGENLMVRYMAFVRPIMVSGNIEEDKGERVKPKA